MTMREMTKEENARRLWDKCQGDGDFSCLECGQALDRDSAEELRQGLCWEHRV